MKYKLINHKTKEETLCDKVTIDGFDYYITDYGVKKEGVYCIDIEAKIFKDENHFPISIGQRMIIATDNPSIDIPKVIGIINEIVKKAFYKEDGINFKRSTIGADDWINGLKLGYNHAKETYQFTEEDMASFAEWYFKETFTTELENEFKSTEELLQIWKEQKPTTIYYE